MRQFELASFQDAQAHKLTQMRKKHKEEIAELKLKIKELDWNDDGWDSMVSKPFCGVCVTFIAIFMKICVFRRLE